VPSQLLGLEYFKLNASGKIDRTALPRPVDVLSLPEAPATETEKRLAELWAEVLRRERVGVTENFFAAGGHSLAAAQLAARLEAEWERRVPVRLLFEAPTIREQAQRLEELNLSPSLGPPLVAQDRQGPVPLSFSQERLWFLAQLEPESPAYHIPAAVRLQGTLDLIALEKALGLLVERHESLRTVFINHEGKPAQLIQPPFPVRIEVQSAIEKQELADFFRTPFNLETGPLFRVKAVQLAEADFLLAVVIHHIIADGLSAEIFVRELSHLYAAAHSGKTLKLPQLPVQFADFALWQRSWLTESQLDDHLEYWRRQLNAAPRLLELPTDFPRPARLSFQGGHVTKALGLELSRQITMLAGTHQATMFMTLMAAFQVLLAKLSGQQTIVVGAPIAGRNRPELTALIGFFVNTLVLKAEIPPDLSFAGLLQQMRLVTLDAFAHQDLPFERLVEELQPARQLNQTPIFQVVFTWNDIEAGGSRLENLTVSGIHKELGESAEPVKFDLTLVAGQNEKGIWLRLQYHRDLFLPETVTDWLERFETLLHRVCEQPEQPLGRVSLLSENDWQTWKQANLQHDFPVTETLSELFDRTAAEYAEAVAISYEPEAGKREVLSYGELNQQANGIAGWLQEQGVTSGSRVVVYLERSVELVAAIVGVVKAGGVYVPVDPATPAERLAFIVADAAPGAILTHTSLLHRLPETTVPLHCAENWLSPQSSVLSPQCSVLSPEAVAYVIYTSGTTGQPKGVEVKHANVVRLFKATAGWFHFTEQDVWTLFHSAAFDFSVWEMWGALLYGGRLVVVDYWTSRTPEAFGELLEREQVTVLNQTPTAFYGLQRALVENPRKLALRYVIFGGEALEVAKLRPWFEELAHCRDAEFAQRFRGEKPSDLSPQSSVLSPRLINMYGITETTVHVTYREITAEDLEAARVGSPIGVPIPDLAVSIVDANLEPVPVGVWGE
ncbi:MAG: AMP-binding protein, partial [Blastocatellia bacterium]|nr:AMP-binding protein [Blastocatellia bacterium]